VKRQRAVAQLAAMLLLASCARAPAGPAQARWTLTVSASVNADAHGQAAPLLVRLYALSARDAFDRATFFELYDHDRTVLGTSALERSVLVLKPGEHVRFVRPLDAATRAFAVVAAYRRIDSAKWRAVVDLDPAAPARDVEIAASFDASAATLALKRANAAGRDTSAIGRWIEPIWKKLAGSIGAG
jgi:type VI secretion system protein VasD